MLEVDNVALDTVTGLLMHPQACWLRCDAAAASVWLCVATDVTPPAFLAYFRCGLVQWLESGVHLLRLSAVALESLFCFGMLGFAGVWATLAVPGKLAVKPYWHWEDCKRAGCRD
jgi:hypothetical protein